MKPKSPLAVLSLTVLWASMPAMAQQDVQRDRDIADRQRAAGNRQSFLPNPEPKRAGAGSERTLLRDASAGQPSEEPRPIPVQGVVSTQSRERLSPEERRQLRRDINAAGRDIYRRSRPE